MSGYIAMIRLIVSDGTRSVGKENIAFFIVRRGAKIGKQLDLYYPAVFDGFHQPNAVYGIVLFFLQVAPHLCKTVLVLL